MRLRRHPRHKFFPNLTGLFLTFVTLPAGAAQLDGRVPCIGGEGGSTPGMLYYKMYGAENKDKPVLLLVHGNGRDGTAFNEVAPELARNYRVLVVDQPGNGRSDENPSNDYSAGTMAASLNRLLERIGIPKVVLLGHSLGARTAVSFAGLFPGKVDKLIVEDMEMRARYQQTPARTAELMSKAEMMKKDFTSLDFASRKALVDKLIKYHSRGEAEKIVEHCSRRNPNGTYTLLIRPWVPMLQDYQTTTQDFLPTLKRITVPVLIMRAEHNSSVSSTGLEEMRRELKNTNVQFLPPIPGSTHDIHTSTPKEFVEALNRFARVAPDPTHTRNPLTTH